MPVFFNVLWIIKFPLRQCQDWETSMAIGNQNDEVAKNRKDQVFGKTNNQPKCVYIVLLSRFRLQKEPFWGTNLTNKQTKKRVG